MTDKQLDPRKLLGFDQLADGAPDATTTARLLTKVGTELTGQERAPVETEERAH